MFYFRNTTTGLAMTPQARLSFFDGPGRDRITIRVVAGGNAKSTGFMSLVCGVVRSIFKPDFVPASTVHMTPSEPLSRVVGAK